MVLRSEMVPGALRKEYLKQLPFPFLKKHFVEY